MLFWFTNYHMNYQLYKHNINDTFKFRDTLFSKIRPNFYRPHDMPVFKIPTSISLNPIFDKINLILYQQAKNSMT